MVDAADAIYNEIGVIRSWSRLADLVREYGIGCYADGGKPWLFRGVRKISYKLIPSIGRDDLNRQGFSRAVRPFSKAHEHLLLERFQKQARPYLSFKPETDIEWLSIAQHHGAPTRLLDWTESILVAAFFATEVAGTDGDAGIYAVPAFLELSKDEDLFSIRRPRLYRPPHISPRIPAQRSVFSITVDPAKALVSRSIHLWRIEQQCCLEIKRLLDAAAVNHATLFPDLDGLAKNLGWRFKWGI